MKTYVSFVLVLSVALTVEKHLSTWRKLSSDCVYQRSTAASSELFLFPELLVNISMTDAKADRVIAKRALTKEINSTRQCIAENNYDILTVREKS